MEIKRIPGEANTDEEPDSEPAACEARPISRRRLCNKINLQKIRKGKGAVGVSGCAIRVGPVSQRIGNVAHSSARVCEYRRTVVPSVVHTVPVCGSVSRSGVCNPRIAFALQSHIPIVCCLSNCLPVPFGDFSSACLSTAEYFFALSSLLVTVILSTTQPAASLPTFTPLDLPLRVLAPAIHYCFYIFAHHTRRRILHNQQEAHLYQLATALHLIQHGTRITANLAPTSSVTENSRYSSTFIITFPQRRLSQ